MLLYFSIVNFEGKCIKKYLSHQEKEGFYSKREAVQKV